MLVRLVWDALRSLWFLRLGFIDVSVVWFRHAVCSGHIILFLAASHVGMWLSSVVYSLHASSRVRGDSKLYAFFFIIPSVPGDRLNNHTV